MMKVILIDDEPLARMIVREYLQDYSQVEIVAECSDGFEGAKAIALHKPDLVFLDIQMPKINGFEMLEIVDEPPAIIFTTAFDEYAIRAFETHAVDYLLKPFSKARFDKAMQKLLEQSNLLQQKEETKTVVDKASNSPSQSERIVVKTGGKIKIIPVQDIYFLEAADDYVKIVIKEGGFLKNKTMSFFEKVLPAVQFVRCHRSYIVNIENITRIEPYEKEGWLAILKTGQQLPVSKSGHAKLKSVLGL